MEPVARDLIYEFVGEHPEVSEENLRLLLKNRDTTDDKVLMITDYLLYLGSLGVKLDQDKPHYIYDFGYDLRILKARHRKNPAQSPFFLNPAFWPALGIIPSV